MSCDPNTLLLYISGELSREQAEQVEAHIAECPSCAQDIQDMQGLEEHAGILPQPKPRRDVVQAAMDQAWNGAGKRTLPAKWLRFAAAACLLVVAVAGALQWRSSPPQPDDFIAHAQVSRDLAEIRRNLDMVRTASTGRSSSFNQMAQISTFESRAGELRRSIDFVRGGMDPTTRGPETSNGS
ncbi:MAG: zf-HC2 domain-containing protein [Desulfovibrio sp.]|nr:MAG: zf-HC2 domain-containing protein [Desulfovibrio sp.]